MQKGQQFTHLFHVSEEVYNGFLITFKDNNPLHTDDAYAQSKKFQSKVMHGNILNGFLSYFIGECLPIKNVIIHTQQIKYILPVYINDKLNFFAQIEDIYESVQTIEIVFYFKNATDKKVAKGKIQIGVL